MLEIRKPYWFKENKKIHKSESVQYGIDVKFADHKATIVENTDNFFVIDWRHKDGRSDYAVRYIVDKKKGAFIVYGDLGGSIANWYNSLDPEKLVGYLIDINYYVGKISIGTGEVWRRDYGLAMKEFEKQKDTLIKDNEHYPGFIEEIKRDYNNMVYLYDDTYSNELVELYQKYNGDDSNPYELDKYISPRVFLWAAGYILACEQLGMIKFYRD